MWQHELVKRARTRFCMPEDGYDRLHPLFSNIEANREAIRLQLESASVYVCDLLQLLRNGECDDKDDVHHDIFFSTPQPAHTFRCSLQQEETLTTSLSIIEFINQEESKARACLALKRDHVLRSNTIQPRVHFLFSLDLLLSSQAADSNEYPIPRITRLPLYVTTIVTDTNFRSNETTDLCDKEEEEKLPNEDEEVVEEVVFRTIEEFGPTHTVFAELAQRYHVTVKLVQEICRDSTLHQVKEPRLNVMNGLCNTVDANALVDSYRKLYCPYCFVFDCPVHGHGETVLKRSVVERKLVIDMHRAPTSLAKSTLAFSVHCRRLFPGDEAAAKRMLMMFDQASANEPLPHCREATSRSTRFHGDDEDGNAAASSSKWHLPCNHHGPCTSPATCSCIKWKRKCLATCACTCCDNLFQGCRCGSSCDPTKRDCTCIAQGKLCDPALCTCSCELTAIVHRRNPPRLAVGMSSIHVGGWGTFTKQDISKDAFIGEYCGEIIDQEEVQHRLDRYDCNKMFYLFELAEYDNNSYDLDSFRKGSTIKYVNDCTRAESNCYPRSFVGPDGQPRICLFAKHDIKRGDELCFDYGPQSKCIRGSSKTCTNNNNTGLLK